MYLLRRLVTSGSELLEPKTQSDSSKLVRKFGKKGKGKGQFNMPCGIAVTKSGRYMINPFVTSGLLHHYHLDESISTLTL